MEIDMKKKKMIEGFNTVANEESRQAESKTGKAKEIMFLFCLVILMLIILTVLIKMDVGGFGSQVLRPVLKDVPVVRKILPEPTDEEVAQESDYKTLAQAVDKINELEQKVKQLEEEKESYSSDDTSAVSDASLEEIKQLKEQIKQLKVYETNQKTFAATKEQFYKEVINNDNVNVSDYTKWYESMDKDTAAKLYKEAVAEQNATQEQKELAKSYESMKPAQAADILQAMSGDMDTVAAILNEMSASNRGKIMGEMEPAFAAKITKKISS